MANRAGSNGKLAGKWLGAVLIVMGLALALVPLYQQWLPGVEPQVQTPTLPAQPAVDQSRVIHVELVAQVNQDMAWQFTPKVVSIDVHPGQVVKTAYLAVNLADARMVGQPVPLVAPLLAAAHVNKIDCFCFKPIALEAQQSIELPLVFYIQPSLPESITSLTLTFTLFDITKKAAAEHLAWHSPVWIPLASANRVL